MANLIHEKNCTKYICEGSVLAGSEAEGTSLRDCILRSFGHFFRSTDIDLKEPLIMKFSKLLRKCLLNTFHLSFLLEIMRLISIILVSIHVVQRSAPASGPPMIPKKFVDLVSQIFRELGNWARHFSKYVRILTES